MRHFHSKQSAQIVALCLLRPMVFHFKKPHFPFQEFLIPFQELFHFFPIHAACSCSSTVCGDDCDCVYLCVQDSEVLRCQQPSPPHRHSPAEQPGGAVVLAQLPPAQHLQRFGQVRTWNWKYRRLGVSSGERGWVGIEL